MRANPSWTNVPKTHHKTSDPKIFISHIPLLNFAGAALHITPGMCANPEPTFQRYTTKPQTVRFSSHTSLHVTPRMCANPSWTNVPRHTTNFRSDFFISHVPVLNFAGTDYTTHVCHPEPTFQRYTTKPQTLRFSSHTSLFWTLLEQLAMLHHACEPTHPVPTSQDTPPQTTND